MSALHPVKHIVELTVWHVGCVRPQAGPVPDERPYPSETHKVIASNAPIVTLTAAEEDKDVPFIECPSDIRTTHAPGRLSNISQQLLRCEEGRVVPPVVIAAVPPIDELAEYLVLFCCLACALPIFRLPSTKASANADST